MRQILAAVLVGWMVVGMGQTTAPSTQPTDLIGALEKLPRNLWPLPGDTPQIRNERDRLLLQQLRPQTYTFKGTIEAAGILGGTDAKGVKRSTVRMQTIVSLWRKQRKILCDAVFVVDDASHIKEWKKDQVLDVSGNIASVFSTDQIITVVIKNANAISITPPK